MPDARINIIACRGIAEKIDKRAFDVKNASRFQTIRKLFQNAEGITQMFDYLDHRDNVQRFGGHIRKLKLCMLINPDSVHAFAFQEINEVAAPTSEIQYFLWHST